MKIFCVLSAFALVGSCATTKYSTKIENLKSSIHLSDSATVTKYANTITANELSNNLYKFSSIEFQGRKTGEFGQKKAVEFLKSFYQNENIASPFGGDDYFQDIPRSYFPDDIKGSSENVLAYIEGSEKPNEVIIISAHLDHLGIDENEIFVGADDNGSGTVAILEMAQAFKIAQKEGHGPKRSILFLHVTAEEIGLQGSQFYSENPVFKLENTVADLNIDMIGRVDHSHKDNPNYVYLIGADRLSTELHYISEKINKAYFNFDIDYKYNRETDRAKIYFRSDHYNFAKHNIPVIFYFNGEHEDYHEPSDTPDKINYKLLEKRTQFIFVTAWQLANQDRRIIPDKAS
ncbi:MAG TPA: M28 family metallopeptidase [Flavobacteriaceae bacterium]|nr:M28 family metallopeptidase [Flavobacteriaceae bacterium]